MPKDKVTLTVTMDRDEYDRLRALADETRMSMAAILRRSIPEADGDE